VPTKPHRPGTSSSHGPTRPWSECNRRHGLVQTRLAMR
jgi:hypothetical protein